MLYLSHFRAVFNYAFTFSVDFEEVTLKFLFQKYEASSLLYRITQLLNHDTTQLQQHSNEKSPDNKFLQPILSSRLRDE
jgi:hypothetical protein